MIAQADQLLGVGLYTAAEAARYARVPSARMAARWVRGAGRQEPVIRAELVDDPDRFISFRDFAQIQAIRAIQLFDDSIGLRKIREAIDHFEQSHALDYPLARHHKLLMHGRDLWIGVAGVNWDPHDPDDSGFEQATGRRGKGQYMIRHIAEQYQRDMAYHENGLASSYSLFRRKRQKITMDPTVHFGQPMLACGYSLETLLNAFKSEGSVKAAAEAYGVSANDVTLALECHNHLGLLSS